jgi:hypothetical protein
MSMNVTAQALPLQPETDEVIYLQTPRGSGERHLPEEDSWDLAEEKARQEAASPTPVAGGDIDSASTDSSSDSSSVDSASSATASPPASATASATRRMTAAVPANAPAAQPKLHPYAYAGLCAFMSVTSIGTGIIFTLLATGDLPIHRPQYPEEITADKALAGIAYLAALVTGGCAIRSAINNS